VPLCDGCVGYAALMTDVYPPFRLDQGGEEVVTAPPEPTPLVTE
jgi:hypothetical protein